MRAVETQDTKAGRAAAHARGHPRHPPADVVTGVLLEANAVNRLIEPEVVAGRSLVCGSAAWTMTDSVLPLDAGWLAH